jgi:hypothetical protein
MQFLRKFKAFENNFFGMQMKGLKTPPLKKILARTLDRTCKVVCQDLQTTQSV